MNALTHASGFTILAIVAILAWRSLLPAHAGDPGEHRTATHGPVRRAGLCPARGCLDGSR